MTGFKYPNTLIMSSYHTFTNRDVAEWLTDQALAHSIESINARFGPRYAEKNPDLVGTYYTQLLKQINILDAADRYQDAIDRRVNEVKKPTPKVETKTPVIKKEFTLNSKVPELKSVPPLKSPTKYQMTLKILQENFPNSFFTAKQAYDAIRPHRWNPKVSKFQDEKTFRGTILRELQVLEKKGILCFVDQKGTYCLR